MSEKPEALRLAEELYAFHAAKKEMPSVGGQMLGLERYRIVASGEAFSQIRDAADALLRQHADNERLSATAFQAQNAAIELAYKYQRLWEQLERIAYASMSTHLNAAQMVTSLQEIAKAALRREDKT